MPNMPSLVSPKVTGPSFASIRNVEVDDPRGLRAIKRHGPLVRRRIFRSSAARHSFVVVRRPTTGPATTSFRPVSSDGPEPLALRPEIDAIDIAVCEPARPLVGMVMIFVGKDRQGVGPCVGLAGRPDQREEERLVADTEVILGQELLVELDLEVAPVRLETRGRTLKRRRLCAGPWRA